MVPTEVSILGHILFWHTCLLFMFVHVNVVPSKLIGNVHSGIHSSIGLCKQFHLHTFLGGENNLSISGSLVFDITLKSSYT